MRGRMPAGTIAPARPMKTVASSRSIASQMAAAWPRLRPWKAVAASRRAISEAEAEPVTGNGVTSSGRPLCMSGSPAGSCRFGGLEAALEDADLQVAQAEAALEIVDDVGGVEVLAGEDVRPE